MCKRSVRPDQVLSGIIVSLFVNLNKFSFSKIAVALYSNPSNQKRNFRGQDSDSNTLQRVDITFRFSNKFAHNAIQN